MYLLRELGHLLVKALGYRVCIGHIFNIWIVFQKTVFALLNLFMFYQLLPPANKGIVFTGVCHSVQGWWVSWSDVPFWALDILGPISLKKEGGWVGISMGVSKGVVMSGGGGLGFSEEVGMDRDNPNFTWKIMCVTNNPQHKMDSLFRYMKVFFTSTLHFNQLITMVKIARSS